MSEMVFLNGALVSSSRAMVSALDYGFLYGYGLFETMRAYGGRVFCLERHLRRLERSAGILGIPIENLNLGQAVTDVIAANGISDGRIRIAVSYGEGQGFTADSCGKPTVLVLALSYQAYLEEVYHCGFKAVVSSITRNSRSLLSRLKTANYLESILAKQEAEAAGADEAICLNERGFIAEGSMSNIFVVAGGVLMTPGEDNGILPGVTRGVVLEMANRLRIKALARDITLDELADASEAFLTNSMLEIMPLTEVNGKSIGSGSPGEVTRRLMAAYRQMVKEGAR